VVVVVVVARVSVVEIIVVVVVVVVTRVSVVEIIVVVVVVAVLLRKWLESRLWVWLRWWSWWWCRLRLRS
jgi:hypothetical protein